VAGWHLGVDVFRRLKVGGIPNVHLASHRTWNEIPAEVVEAVGAERVHVFPNLGYDWGAFRQFCDAGLHRDFEYVIFMHDDVEILDPRLFDAAITQLVDGAAVVGNGRNSERNDWVSLGEGHSYAHAVELPPHLGFAHETVRGSFFAMRSRTIDELGGFDVFWDPFHLMVETGNLSLIATCSRIAARHGDRAFAFLGDADCRSEFLIEAVRGGAAPERRTSLTCRLKAQVFKLYKKVGMTLVREEIAGADPRSLRIRFMRRVISLLSGNDACHRRPVFRGER
jgi:hypothetical protein